MRILPYMAASFILILSVIVQGCTHQTILQANNGNKMKVTVPEQPSNMSVYFDDDSTEIDQDSLKNIEDIVTYYHYFKSKKRFSHIVLEASTSMKGSREYNLGLGRSMADSIKAILVSRGVDADDIESISFGEERPQCRESMLEACQAQNRRVNIILKR